MYEIGRGTRAHEKRRGIERDEGVREDAPLSAPSTYKKPGEGREKKGKKVEGWEKGEGVERKRAELWTRKSEFGRISRVLQSAQAPGPDSGLARITRAGGVRGREVAGISGEKISKPLKRLTTKLSFSSRSHLFLDFCFLYFVIVFPRLLSRAASLSCITPTSAALKKQAPKLENYEASGTI